MKNSEKKRKQFICKVSKMIIFNEKYEARMNNNNNNNDRLTAFDPGQPE